MKRETLDQCLVFLLLAVVAVAARIYFRDLPNFAPVAALALFSGFFFRSAVAAVALPLSVMIASDWFLGGYHWGMMVTVYAMLALPVACRGWIRHWIANHAAWSTALRLLGCSFGGAVAFFLATNFATWYWSEIYPPTWAGLVDCYVQAIPFFRYTLVGDLSFGLVLFGGWGAIRYGTTARRSLALDSAS